MWITAARGVGITVVLPTDLAAAAVFAALIAGVQLSAVGKLALAVLGF